MPSEDELGTFYPTEYYSHQPADVAELPQTDGWRNRLRNVLLPLRTGEPSFDHPGRMVDIGSGSGWMVDHYRRLGWEAHGVEYSEAACRAGTAAGREMHQGSLRDARFDDESYDYVRSNHSFEHLNDPQETLAEIWRILRPGGTVFIGVPDSAGLMPRLFGPEWYYVGAPVHVINYDRRNLVELLQRHGFDVESVRGNSTHGGTVGSLQSWWIGRRQKGQLDAGIVTKPPFILLGFWLSRLLDLLRAGDCVEVIARKPAREAPTAGQDDPAHP